MQPADPMGIPGDTIEDNLLPEHLPPQMALAPEQRPYDHPHVIRSEDVDDDSEEGRRRRRMASHSLSPEHLGVTGYVKDVAGFVKDVYQGARERKVAQHQPDTSRERQPSEAAVARAGSPPPRPRRTSSPLADAVTSLFPGLDPNAHACSHADGLRHDLMKQHGRDDAGDPTHYILHD